ncbi:MAG: recombinase family protein [Actinomycetota bacterium]
MTRVAIYTRTSRAEGGDETSIPVQLADCRERAESEGWDVVAEYVDAGISGWKRKTRPGYEAVYADAAEGRIDAVLVRDYERLLRSDIEGKRWLDLYDAQGFGRFVFADEADINLSRARDRKDWKDRVSAAVYYSDRLSEKVRRSKERARALGEYTGGVSEPYGYRRVDGALQVDPQEAGVIHDVVARIAAGVALNRITVDLNKMGTTTSKGARWRPVTMRRLLLSDHLLGARGYLPILSDEEAAVVKARFAHEKRKVGRPAGRRHPLGGLLRCGECGSNMTGAGAAYRCTSSAGGCGRISIKAFPLERHVLLKALRHWYEGRSGDEVAQDGPSKPDPEALSELRQIEEDLQATRALVGDGSMRPADAAPILKQLAERQEKAAKRVGRSLQTAPEPPVSRLTQMFTRDELRAVGIDRPAGGASAEEFHLRWEDREPEAVAAVRDLVTSQVERITIHRRERRGKSFDPTRVQIAWHESA